MTSPAPTKAFPTTAALITLAIAFAQPAAAQGYTAQCQRLAGSPDEPNNPDKIGVLLHQIASVRAIETCTAARDALGYEAKARDPVAAYRLSRAYMAIGPRQDVRTALHLQRIVWAGGKRSADLLRTEAAAWYAKAGQQNLTPATYEKAANEGSLLAQMILAYLHAEKNLNALGQDPDLDTAISWMQRAADQNYPPAQYQLGVLLSWKNQHEEALRWYQRAAEQNWQPAIAGLGIAYAYGKGTPQDGKRGLMYLGKAADAGNVHAHIAIGHLFLKGTGVKKDPQLARRWYKKAADMGSQEAVNILKQTESHGNMTDATAIAVLAGLGLLFLMSQSDSSPTDNTRPSIADQQEEYEEQMRQNWRQNVCPWMTDTEKAIGGCGW